MSSYRTIQIYINSQKYSKLICSAFKEEELSKLKSKKNDFISILTTYFGGRVKRHFIKKITQQTIETINNYKFLFNSELSNLALRKFFLKKIKATFLEAESFEKSCNDFYFFNNSNFDFKIYEKTEHFLWVGFTHKEVLDYNQYHAVDEIYRAFEEKYPILKEVVPGFKELIRSLFLEHRNKYSKQEYISFANKVLEEQNWYFQNIIYQEYRLVCLNEILKRLESFIN